MNFASQTTKDNKLPKNGEVSQRVAHNWLMNIHAMETIPKTVPAGADLLIIVAIRE